MVGNGKAQLLISPQGSNNNSQKVRDCRHDRHSTRTLQGVEQPESTAIWTGHSDFNFMCMLSAIFDAGRIQGIREERQKASTHKKGVV